MCQNGLLEGLYGKVEVQWLLLKSDLTYYIISQFVDISPCRGQMGLNSAAFKLNLTKQAFRGFAQKSWSSMIPPKIWFYIICHTSIFLVSYIRGHMGKKSAVFEHMCQKGLLEGS